MLIEDSGEVRNVVKGRSLLVAAGVYLLATAFSGGAALLLLLPCAALAYYLSEREIEVAKSTASEFKKTYPLKHFGSSYGDFEHVFYHRRRLEPEIVEAITRGLKEKTTVTSVEPIQITDTDTDLKAPESRLFLRADAGRTGRGTVVTLILRLSNFGSMQSVRWWAMGGGYIDRDKRFNFAAYAGLSIWFWLVPFLKKEMDLLSFFRTVHAGAYNGLDLSTQMRCLHDAVFDAMVDELEKHGIDTSDLRTQRMQVMNITVAGGKLNIGNVIQGAMNTLSGGAKRQQGAQA